LTAYSAGFLGSSFLEETTSDSFLFSSFFGGIDYSGFLISSFFATSNDRLTSTYLVVLDS
jgi:hypothetical protein